jgi:hypothetical protein
MSIQPLPPAVVAQIKSSITITSLNCVVTELLTNSLDAGSTKVDINVDYGRGGCIVEDDGLGILPAEFGESGGLGKLYRKKSRHRFGGDKTENWQTLLNWTARLLFMVVEAHLLPHFQLCPCFPSRLTTTCIAHTIL